MPNFIALKAHIKVCTNGLEMYGQFPHSSVLGVSSKTKKQTNKPLPFGFCYMLPACVTGLLIQKAVVVVIFNLSNLSGLLNQISALIKLSAKCYSLFEVGALILLVKIPIFY